VRVLPDSDEQLALNILDSLEGAGFIIVKRGEVDDR
jgi:hypothetical protein